MDGNKPKWFIEVRLNEKSFASDKNRIEEKRRSVQRDEEKRIIEYGKKVLASQGHEKAPDATDVVVLTITPGIANDKTRE